MKSPITTHVLDTALGKPAAGVHVVLQFWQSGRDWTPIAEALTNEDGRILDWLPPETKPTPGVYRLMFDTRAYFERRGVATFFPAVSILFEIRQPDQHYHVPLLLSPYGYSTYRGS
jgi:5-hydroxyisourate hydrolase